MKNIELTIDGKIVSVEQGKSVLDAALENGVDIPHICYDPRLTPTGSCRLCLVEIEGQRGLQTSCSRIAEEGMVVSTETKEIAKSRKSTLELMISEHRMVCATCDADGDCLLQDYAYRYHVNEDRFPKIKPKVKVPNFTNYHKAIQYDPTKCVRCMRCVKICEEVQGANAITLRERAGQVLVTTAFNTDLRDSSCESCGQCVGVCPVGAMTNKPAVKLGKVKDLEKVLTTCVYCGVGCQLELNVDRKNNRLVKVTSTPGIIPNDGNTCVKGRFGMDFIGSPERLTHPLIKENGEFRKASWDEALSLVVSKLSSLKAEFGPDALASFSSAKTTNEDNYVMQRFTRAVLGTNNIDHCARLCHASTVTGLAKSFGSGAMTNSIAEIRKAPVIFVIGSNTTENHPVIGITIRQAVRSGDTQLILADPRKISLSGDAGIYMQHKPGTDVALVNAMMNVIISEGLEDKEFIETRTEDYDLVRKAVERFTPEMAAGICGVSAKSIRESARIYAKASAASIIYSMGITQHATGTDNVLSLANLAMLTGNVGKENAGVNPLRGQNNVQGACDMGALPDVYPGYQKVDLPEAQAKFQKAWNAELSIKPGLTVVEIMHAAEAKEIRGIYIVGENPMLSDPDLNHVRQALTALDFLVVQDIFLTETAELADVVLPATSFAEKDGTFTNTERRVQRVRKALDPPGEAREDWRVICDVANRMGYEMDFEDASAIQDEIASLAPIYGGITYDRLTGVGLQWPCHDKNHPGTKFLHSKKFSRGKGKFYQVDYIPPQELPDEEYPFILTTGRMLEHWHTGTMTRRSKVLDYLEPEGFIELNPEDAVKLGVSEGGVLKVKSRRGEIDVPARITEKVFPGCVFLTFHFKENPANALTIAALDPIAKIPEFKACAVSIHA
ncbi:MAG: formate dehydrogenase subunit alpha [Spirochaetes bacterium]|nr:MAG: formate dehydrogenase subunit alpha [Spirochaetota bacterium]RKX98805.1 MAG: formate dehydrogenase subunit alpha [Spirochaetota bacterium]